MTAARTLALVRLAFACSVAVIVAGTPPDAARLFGSFARRHVDAHAAGVGWLGAVVTNALYDGPAHYGALVAASTFAALLALFLVERRARRQTSDAGAVAAAALAALCSLDALHAGAGTATLAFTAAVVLLLERSSGGAVCALAAVTVLWCNVEAAGVLAPAFALVAALGRTLDGAGTVASRRAWLAAGAAVGATFATPLGLAYPANALAALQLAGASAQYAPWSPADLMPHGYRLGVMLLVVLALARGMRGRTTRDALLAAAAFLISLASGTLVAIFGIVAAPIAVAAFARAGAPAARRSGHALRTGAALAALALVAGGAAGARRMPLARDEPYAAIAGLAHAGGVQRVFCSDVGWCDAALASGLGVVADGRIANAPQAVRDAQIAIVRARKTWRTRLDGLHVDAVVTGANSALATLLTESHWTPYASAGTTVILLRRVPAS
ncbi:MAG: hypothetical protein NVSMB19_20500 [Vulcanimicrobiaceae bacterium]